MATMLTWCEECEADMHVHGGKMCEKCTLELCLNCFRKHICPDDDADDEDWTDEDEDTFPLGGTQGARH